MPAPASFRARYWCRVRRRNQYSDLPVHAVRSPTAELPLCLEAAWRGSWQVAPFLAAESGCLTPHPASPGLPRLPSRAFFLPRYGWSELSPTRDFREAEANPLILLTKLFIQPSCAEEGSQATAVALLRINPIAPGQSGKCHLGCASRDLHSGSRPSTAGASIS
jgi:hypothetical protein